MVLKKLIVIFLAACLLLDFTGYHIIFCLRQEAVKAEMKEAIRTQTYSEDETDFIFSLNDKQGIKQLDWEGDDEFSFNGEMYDVIEKKTENGKRLIRAIADQQETALLKNAKDHWDQNEKSNKAADELYHLLQSLFHSSGTEEFVFIKPSVNKISFISLQLPSEVTKIPTPPPRAECR